VDVNRVVQHLQDARVRPELIDEVVGQLDDILYNASQRGVALSNKFNFDYQDLSNVERAMRIAFPFATWLMKATPFYAEQAIRHPVIGATIREQRQMSERHRTERGLSDRFRGKMRTQTGSDLLSAITGVPSEVYVDPLAMFMPFAGSPIALQKLQYQDDEEVDPVQSALTTLDALGFSLGPIPDLTGRVSGITGDMSTPAGSYIRAGGPIAGATALASKGVEKVTGTNPGWYYDVNRGPQKIEETVRQLGDAATHGGQGREVTNMLDVMTERRLDEMALRETGQPIGSENAASIPYIRARADKSGPLWEKARTEVELERGIQSTTGFISQAIQPQAILTKEEAQIRQAKAGPLVEGAVARALDKAAETNPAAPADPALVEKILAANAQITQQTGRPTPDIVQQRLDNPTNENMAWVSKEIYTWEVEQEPLLRGYGSGGTPEARLLGNQMGKLGVAGRGLDPNTFAQMIQANKIANVMQGKSNSGLQAALAVPGQERAAIQETQPLLREYLAWRTINPGKEIEDFLKEKYTK
jgi:hypothetical protein